MIHLRPSRNILRQFTPVTGRRCIHTPNAFRRSAQPSSLLRTLPPSLPQRHLGIVSRCLSQTATVRDKAVTPQLTESQEGAQSPDAVDRWANTPAYDLTFTCKECSDRSTHRVSKQGYHKGTVLITCPGCKSRHLISDHLKIFSDKAVTLEDLMKEKGQLIRKGALSTEGDVEFWDDGTEVTREPQGQDKKTPS